MTIGDRSLIRFSGIAISPLVLHSSKIFVPPTGSSSRCEGLAWVVKAVRRRSVNVHTPAPAARAEVAGSPGSLLIGSASNLGVG